MSDLLVIAIVAAVIIGGPLASIWAINTLLGLAIAYTFKTWLAAFILGALLTPSSRSSSK